MPEQARAPTQKRSTLPVVWTCSPEAFTTLTGYTRLVDNPEIQAAIQRVADMVGSMTIHLMSNTANGDKRMKNELSAKIDITPCKYITRKAWVEVIVKDMIINGNNIQVPHYSGSYLDDIEPIPQSRWQIINDGYGYHVVVRGKRFEHDEVLHFVHNPDTEHPWNGLGTSVLLKNVAKQLAQARTTANKLMESPAPGLVVKVDALTEEFQSVEGRKKLREQYLDSSENGEPWFVPADGFEVTTVKPLNLKDLAIIDSITLDKKTAASIIGVPPFLVGAGDFDADEFNNFIRMIVLPIAREIEQELTRKLLTSPKWYFRFNPRSLYAYSITELGEVMCNLADRAVVTRNEARDAIGYDPYEGLDEMAILENYVPYAKIGDQKKLQKGGSDDGK